jgi:uncharacterized protein YdiU (UPF0061 family)
MRVGFVHGVMNTDNMSVLGLTIDYGPYGWLENYDPDWTPNTTDSAHRRYRYGQQPAVAQWNLLQLANAIFPLIGEAKPLEDLLRGYVQTYQSASQSMMAQKLGLNAFDPTTDPALLTELDAVLRLCETDMTIFYRNLALIDGGVDGTDLIAPLLPAYYVPEQLTADVRLRIERWLRGYLQRTQRDAVSPERRRERMNAVNPKYVLRNYLAQLAIDKAQQRDYSMVNELLEVLRNPYTDQPGREAFEQKRPDWARHRVGCSMLSCSS